MTAGNSIPRWRNFVILQTSDEGGIVLYDPAGGQVFRVDGIAAEVCKSVDGKKDMKAIVAEFIETRENLPKDQFVTDVKNLMKKLESLSLLEFVSQ